MTEAQQARLAVAAPDLYRLVEQIDKWAKVPRVHEGRLAYHIEYDSQLGVRLRALLDQVRGDDGIQ